MILLKFPNSTFAHILGKNLSIHISTKDGDNNEKNEIGTKDSEGRN